MHRTLILASSAALALTALAGCGDDIDSASADGRPTVAVTTSILGDVVSNLVGDAAEVVVVMPAGSDPHAFEASAQQVDQMRRADALVTNGADFEGGLAGAIEGAEAEGVATYHAIDAVEPIAFGEGGHSHDSGEDAHSHDEGDDDHSHDEGEDAHDHEGEDGHSHSHDEGDDAHADEEHDEGDEARADEGEEPHADEGHDHDHEGVDPHFFTDPERMADAAAGIAAFLADEVPALAADGVQEAAGAYVDELRALDASVEETLSSIPDEGRVLVTNHEVFGYFADRYGFEVVGVIVPGGTTGGEPSAANLAELVEVVEAEGVPAVFADTSSPARLAETLASEADTDVAVVELFSESLGDEGSGGETYVEMVTTNAERIADALG